MHRYTHYTLLLLFTPAVLSHPPSNTHTLYSVCVCVRSVLKALWLKDMTRRRGVTQPAQGNIESIPSVCVYVSECVTELIFNCSWFQLLSGPCCEQYWNNEELQGGNGHRHILRQSCASHGMSERLRQHWRLQYWHLNLSLMQLWYLCTASGKKGHNINDAFSTSLSAETIC